MSRTVIHITADLLSIDPTIQRPLDDTRVRRMASAFNPDALGALTVSLRPDGSRVILDGQHRHAVAIAVGYAGKLTCVQYDGLEHADEATLFLVLNETKQVQAVDKFRARVIAGEKDAVAIEAIIGEHGWKVSTSKDAYRLSAIAAFEKVYNGAGVRITGGDVLAANTLHVITASWNGQSNSAHAAIISSLGKFLGWYGGDVDYKKIVAELSGLKPMNLVGDIKASKEIQHCDMANAGAHLLVNLHNKKRRTNRLDAWRSK